MQGMTAEEVGDTYFDELLDRSMILPGEGVNHHTGKINSCQLHDIIREICISKAREENLVFTLQEGGCLGSTQGPIRHLAISSNWKGDKNVFDGMLDLSHVRSLTVFGEWRPYFISVKMRFLRVLDLDDTSRLRNHHLDKIGQLHQLRYLSVQNCIYIWHLPNSIGNLSHLQTLDIEGTRILELPTTITKHRKLQHLQATWRSIGTEKDDDMFEDRRMKPVLQEFFQLFHDGGNWGRMCLVQTTLLLYLVHLFWSVQCSEMGLNMHDIFHIQRYLWVYLHSEDLHGVKAPRGTGKLTSLQNLGVVNVARGQEKVIEEFSALTQLRKLGVTGINKGNEKKFWSAIAAHNQLRSLTVDGDDIDGCLRGDLLPPKHLQSLKLVSPLDRVLHWMHHLQSLSKLDLQRSRLNKDDDIQTLGDIPNLAVLRLGYGAIVMDDLHFLGSSFLSLLVLELYVPSDLNFLRFGKDAMPKLELLQTDKYLEMKGLQFLTNLKEIRMDGEGINKMKMQLEEQYAEHPNLKNISLKLIS